MILAHMAVSADEDRALLEVDQCKVMLGASCQDGVKPIADDCSAFHMLVVGLPYFAHGVV